MFLMVLDETSKMWRPRRLQISSTILTLCCTPPLCASTWEGPPMTVSPAAHGGRRPGGLLSATFHLPSALSLLLWRLMLCVSHHPGSERACPGACHNPGTAIGADTLSQRHPDLILLAFTCCCPKRHQGTSEAEKGVPRSWGSLPSICGRKVVTEKLGGKGRTLAEL